MGKYIDACYGENEYHKLIKGHIDGCIGSELEHDILGTDIRFVKKHVYETIGGIFNQTTYHILPFKKIKSPDFYLPDSNIIGDVKRLNLETLGDKRFNNKCVIKKLNDCIEHTTIKLSNKICDLIGSNNPAICPLGVMEFADYLGADDYIFNIVVDSVENGLCSNFNTVDSILIYSKPVSYLGDDETIHGGRVLQINRTDRIKTALIQRAKVINLDL